MQTVWTQFSPHNVAFDQGPHCLLTRMFMGNTIKVNSFSRNSLNWKWTLGNDRDGQFHWSIRIK